MSKVPVFSPALSTLCLIKSTGFDIESIKKKTIALCSGSKNLSSIIHKRGDFLIIEIIRVVNYEDGMASPQITGNMRAAYKENNGLVKKLLKSLPGSKERGAGPLTFNLFTLGSESSFLNSESSSRPDLLQGGGASGDGMMFQVSSMNRNIVRFNMLLGKQETIMVNEIGLGQSTAKLYILGEDKRTITTPFPLDMVLELDLSGVEHGWLYRDLHLQLEDKAPYVHGPENDIDLGRKKHAYMIEMLSYKRKMLEIFLHQSRVHSIIFSDIADVKMKASFLKEEMYDLHNQINDHMSSHKREQSMDEDKKKASSAKQMIFKKEQELFIRASQKFSFSSEVEHELMRCRSRLKYQLGTLDRGMKEVGSKAMTDDRNWSERSYRETVMRSLREEMEELAEISSELAQSRNILYSNIDILRGFVEAEQREHSDRMGSLMNLLFLVFACIGLADAAGNFVIFILQFGALPEDPTFGEVMFYSMIALMITMVPLSIGAFFLYKAFRRN